MRWLMLLSVLFANITLFISFPAGYGRLQPWRWQEGSGHLAFGMVLRRISCNQALSELLGILGTLKLT